MGLFVYVRNLMLREAKPGGELRRAQTRVTHDVTMVLYAICTILERPAQELVDGQPDVWSSHERFADQDRGDSGSFESFDVAAGADAAFADEHDIGRNLVAKPQGMLEVGAEIREVAVIDPDQIGARGKHTVQVGRVVKFDQSCHSQSLRPVPEAGLASMSSRISAIRRMASAPAERASTTWYSSIRKSLRNTGIATAARTCVRWARCP